jgi:hypothetical protein
MSLIDAYEIRSEAVDPLRDDIVFEFVYHEMFMN